MKKLLMAVAHSSATRGRRLLALLAGLLLVVGISVTAVATPAGADTATYTSSQVGTSGNTPSFSQSGPWTLSWTYDCSNFGNPGNFIVNVNNSSAGDQGVNEAGNGGSGTDYYYDSGTFSFAVDSECDWTLTVDPSAGTPTGTPVTITSTEIGVSGNSRAFSVGGSWTMAWSYNCSNFGGQGNFIVNISQLDGGFTADIGPNELGTSGNGSDSYSDTGTFTVAVDSECAWSITINASGPPPAPPSIPIFPTPVTGMASTPNGYGYWIVDAQGAVQARGNAQNHGSMYGATLNAPISHIVSTPDGRGYWLVAADGGTFAFGDAKFYGSMGGRSLNAPVVDLAPTADGRGYWLVASDGGIFAFGDARFHGSMGAAHLNQPVVGIAPDDATGGYWEVASDGGIFAFGAPFHGSTGGIHLNQPVNGMTPTPNDGGYWFVASDGGLFAFGDARFHGSMGGATLNAPVVGMATDNSTGGYWLVGSDGGIFSFDAPFYGAA